MLTGRIVDDGVLKQLPSGFPMCGFEIDVRRARQDSESGAWVQYAASFDVVVPGNLADKLAQHLQRGREVAVDGFLDVRLLDDGRKTVRVVADAVQLVEIGVRASRAPSVRRRARAR